MKRLLRSSFATLALCTAMLGAPPAQTKAEREALAKVLRNEVHPVLIIYESERRTQVGRQLDLLVFGRDGEPNVVTVSTLVVL